MKKICGCTALDEGPVADEDRYEKVERGGSAKKNSQMIFIKEANQIYENAVKINKVEADRTFIPL